MIESVGDKCSGCSACASICPKGCISMQPNSEGFLYPAINQNVCVKCGLCEKTCPVLHPPVFDEKDVPVAYAVQNKDEKIRLDSASGGAFSAIAYYVLDHGGVVFGALFNEKLEVVHGFVETKEELYKLRRSKYVQSRIGQSFKQVKSFLDSGRWVCFSGTPCQIGGLKSFLHKDYANLVLVDIICHSVPSPKMWEIYKTTQEKKFGSKISEVRFREKTYGFSNPTLTLLFENGKKYAKGVIDPYHAAFTQGMVRKSCAECSFKTWKRVSDFTLYDCWSIGRFNKEWDDNKGTSGILAHSTKATKILEEVQIDLNQISIDFNKSMLLDGVKATQKSKLNLNRTAFFEDLDYLDMYALQKKYYPISIRSRFFSIIKPFFFKIGILQFFNAVKRKYELSKK